MGVGVGVGVRVELRRAVGGVDAPAAADGGGRVVHRAYVEGDCRGLARAEDVARAVAGRKGEGIGAVRLSKARLKRVSSRPVRGLLAWGSRPARHTLARGT